MEQRTEEKTNETAVMCGFLSSTFLALCGLPQFLTVVSQGHADGLSTSFLWMWSLGEWLGLYFVLSIPGRVSYRLPLILNYGLNLILTSTMLVIKIS